MNFLAQAEITCVTNSGCGDAVNTFFDSPAGKMIQYGAVAIGILVGLYALFVIVGALAKGDLAKAGGTGLAALIGVALLFNLQIIFGIVAFLEDIVIASIDLTKDLIDVG